MLKRIFFINLVTSLLFFSLSCCPFLPPARDSQIPEEVKQKIKETEGNDFSLTLLNGETLNLSKLRGKPVVVNFFATWCPPCQEEAPTLEKVYRKYQDKVEFVGVATSSNNKSDLENFIKEKDLSFSIGIDTSGTISQKYNVSAIPATFFITDKGDVADSYVGAISEEDLTQKIEELLK